MRIKYGIIDRSSIVKIKKNGAASLILYTKSNKLAV